MATIKDYYRYAFLSTAAYVRLGEEQMGSESNFQLRSCESTWRRKPMAGKGTRRPKADFATESNGAIGAIGERRWTN
jgi:hypothetical protein